MTTAQVAYQQAIIRQLTHLADEHEALAHRCKDHERRGAHLRLVEYWRAAAQEHREFLRERAMAS